MEALPAVKKGVDAYNDGDRLKQKEEQGKPSALEECEREMDKRWLKNRRGTNGNETNEMHLIIETYGIKARKLGDDCAVEKRESERIKGTTSIV